VGFSGSTELAEVPPRGDGGASPTLHCKMRSFVWRLQRVLQIKAKQEQTKRTELFELTERLAQTRSELITRQRILKDIIADIAAKKPRSRLRQQEFFLRHSMTSDEQVKKLTGKVIEMESQQREKIAELLEVRRFRKGLEKLREEAKKRFISEQEKLEQKELDEAATICFARKMVPDQEKTGE